MDPSSHQRPATLPLSETYTVIRLTALTLPDPRGANTVAIDVDVDKAHVIPTDEHDDLVYMPQRTTQDSVDLLHAAVVLDFNSFDGGERCVGRLREGGPEPVSLFSRPCVGLAVNAAVAGFCVAFFASAFRPLFITGFLTTSHAHLVATTNSLLQWPPVLSLFIGVLSDTVPIHGYQRKPYLIGGWLLASLTLAVAAIVSYSADVTSTDTAIALVALSVIASCGLQIVWVVSLAITVEHAQREPMDERGHFQGAFFLTIVVLAGCALLPIPFVLAFYHEHRGDAERDTAAKLSTTDLSAGLWTHLQQKPVHRIYFFLSGAALLVNARNESVDSAILTWCGIAKQKFGNVTVAQALPKVVAVVVWKLFMINLNWRVLGVAGLALFALCQLALVLTSGFALARGEWIYYGWTAVASIPLGWIEVFMVILPTEVAGVGTEGLAMGVVASCMALIAIMSTTLWDSINQAAGLTFSAAEVAADAATTRHRLILIGVVYALLNLSSVALTPLLPSQKLAAQRWRLFGRANIPASRSLAGAFVLLVAYNLAANWLQVRGN